MRGGKRFFRQPPPPPEHRVNEQISFSPVRLIDADGKQVGVIPLHEARDAAREAGLDLVEVASEARPIVCKILDYGRFLYDRDKRAKESKGQEQEIKDVKVRPNIDDNDFQTKLGMAKRFLKRGAMVRFTVMFRKREMRRPENGYQLLERAIEELDGVAQVDRKPPDQLTSRDLTMVFRPA